MFDQLSHETIFSVSSCRMTHCLLLAVRHVTRASILLVSLEMINIGCCLANDDGQHNNAFSVSQHDKDNINDQVYKTLQ